MTAEAGHREGLRVCVLLGMPREVNCSGRRRADLLVGEADGAAGAGAVLSPVGRGSLGVMAWGRGRETGIGYQTGGSRGRERGGLGYTGRDVLWYPIPRGRSPTRRRKAWQCRWAGRSSRGGCLALRGTAGGSPGWGTEQQGVSGEEVQEYCGVFRGLPVMQRPDDLGSGGSSAYLSKVEGRGLDDLDRKRDPSEREGHCQPESFSVRSGPPREGGGWKNAKEWS